MDTTASQNCSNSCLYQNNLPTWGLEVIGLHSSILWTTLKADLDLPKRPFTVKAYIFFYFYQQFYHIFFYNQQFLATVRFFVHLLFPFYSCTMCPDSSGKLIRLMHICQPASFSLATALKVLNTKIYLHKISLFLLLRLQCNLQQHFKFFIPKKGIVLVWKTRATEELLWKTYWISAHTYGWVKQHTKKSSGAWQILIHDYWNLWHNNRRNML